MSEELTRKIVFEPAYDKTSVYPAKNFGIHSVEIRFYLIGEAGAVQFVLYTGWYKSLIAETSPKDWSLDVSDATIRPPLPADLGFHSRVPMYEGHSVTTDNCPLINTKCYYDGSGLNAYKAFAILVHDGSERLWEFLETYYKDTFKTGAKQC